MSVVQPTDALIDLPVPSVSNFSYALKMRSWVRVCILTAGFHPLENNYFGVCLLIAKHFFKHEPSGIFKPRLEPCWFVPHNTFAQKLPLFNPTPDPNFPKSWRSADMGTMMCVSMCLRLLSSFI